LAIHPLYSAAAVYKTSVEEFRAVSRLSCTTPMMKPTPTTCIATSFDMPRKEQAMGIRNNDPPAIPLAPHAPMVETIQSVRAVGKSTEIPNVFAVASVMIAIVMAAPSIFMVAPSGIETE
jgi:hypothetical protein